MTKKRRKKKRMNVFLKIILVILATLIIGGVAVVGLLSGTLFGYIEGTQLVDVDNMRLNLTSFVYATDPKTGETVELEKLYDTENRIWVSSGEIPENLKNAFVAIEDERFYSHKGVDIKRFTGAVFQYVTHKGNSRYGGSTITQQLIKNLTKDDDYSSKRKIREIYRAINLEKQLSKDEILEYYLNTIYLSQKCNGVASAAQTYFGKNVSDLSLAECASIAGITQFPTKYDPLQNPENNKKRQLVILKKMKELGCITTGEYEEAKAEKLVFADKEKDDKENSQSYFTDAAIDQIIADLMDKYDYTKEYASKILYNGGLKIYLSIDTDIQNKLDTVYNADDTFQKRGTGTQPQSSMVVMDPYTGQVKALIGGRGEKEGKRTLNRATQTLRQPGSTIKPLSVYSPAIEYGLVKPSSVVNDAPVKFGDWAPRNDDRRFLGKITVAAALRGSRNVPAVKICNYITAEAAFDFLKDNYHISTLVKEKKKNGKLFTDIGLSQIALGGLTDGVSVLEMCAAYCTFPNGGLYIKPTTYTKVVDNEGKTILEHSEKGQIAISRTTAEDMVDMLSAAVSGGTGTAARLSNMRVAGKTGTTSSNNDRWFVGFTPYYVGAVWFGYDTPAPLRGYSPNPAAVAWRKVMSEVHKDLPNKKFFADSEGKYSMMVCADSGMRATPACTKLKAEVVSKSNIIDEYCTKHKYKFNKNDLGGGSVQTKVIEKNEQVEGVIDTENNQHGGETPAAGGDTQTPSHNTDKPNTPPADNTPKPPQNDNSAGVIIE